MGGGAHDGRQPLLEISGLRVSVEGAEILRGIDLTVYPGEVYAIMGPNGSGKSTLAHVLAGRDTFTASSLEIPRVLQ